MRIKAWITILVVAGISIFFLFQLPGLLFKYDFELFYPKNDSDTEFFFEFRERFESDNDFVLIGIVNESGVFEESFLNQVASLTDSIEKMAEVQEVLSITNVESSRILPLYPGIYKRKLLRLNQPEYYQIDSAKIHTDPNYLNSLVSQMGKSTCIIVRQQDYLSQEGCFEISDQLQSLVDSYGFDQTHIAGRCLGLSTYVRLIRSEVRIFVGSSALLILIFLFISYRSFWGLWMPTLVVLLTVLWTVGTMSITGKPMDLISNVIPTMLMVIGISNVIHLLSRFLDYLRAGINKNEALINAYNEVGMATIFTSLTTAIGFLSLTTSNVKPVIDMGLYTTLGLAFAFLLTYTLFPALIVLQKKLNAEDIGNTEAFWTKYIQKWYHFIANNKSRVLAAWLILTVIGGIYSTKLVVNSYLLDGLQNDHPQRKAFRFFEDQYAGSRPFELNLSLINQDEPFALENLVALDSIQQYLGSSYGVGHLRSPLNIIKNLNRTLNSGNADFYRTPISENEHQRVIKNLNRYKDKLNLSAFYNEQHAEFRISGKIRDEGSLVLHPKDEALMNYLNENYGNRFDAKITGAATMMDNTHAYIVKNVIRGLIMAIIIIGIIMGFLFKSAAIVIISLITNLVPLIITGGIMGLYGIDMRLSTSIIFIIAFGIAVDDSIHFLSKFNREVRKSATVAEAVQKTFFTTGKAIVVTTLILSGGFLTLAASDFLGTHYLGLFISCTLIIAVLADLMILPSALILFYKKKS